MVGPTFYPFQLIFLEGQLGENDLSSQKRIVLSQSIISDLQAVPQSLTETMLLWSGLWECQEGMVHWHQKKWTW